MSRQRLFSDSTGLVNAWTGIRVYTPVVLGVGFALAYGAYQATDHHAATIGDLGICLVAAVLGVFSRGFVRLFLPHLKTVELDAKYLFVSSIRRAIAIPLREIYDVRLYTRWFIGGVILIEFGRETKLGREVLFSPDHRLGHPPADTVIALLKNAIRVARETSRAAPPNSIPARADEPEKAGGKLLSNES